MKKIIALGYFSLFSILAQGQITGQVTTKTKQALPDVNVYIENTLKGTTTNAEGIYLIPYNTKQPVTLIFKYLGYKSVKKTISPSLFPYHLDIELQKEDIALTEVVLNTNQDPAYEIIKKTIANKSKYLNSIKSYKANFYSRGLMRIKNAPEKILGFELGDFGGGLDSTRSGVIYLSETVSKLEFKKPKTFKEHIVASKVSGNSNGFSFNQASDVNFNFYNNTIQLNSAMVSPIANNALNYYNYKLEGAFYDINGFLINKIQVLPKRKNDRVGKGYVYIVEDQWTLYALEIEYSGKQLQIPSIEHLVLKQHFSHTAQQNIWALISQTIDFKFDIFGFKSDGRFSAVYSDYEFNIPFSKKHFTAEVLSFEKEANKKDSIFWKKTRPVPLTNEEVNDYIKKDSIQLIRDSKPYKDSVDKANNSFKLENLISGYTYSNSFKKWRFSVSSPIETLNFNTVMGWNSALRLNYFKWNDSTHTQLNASAHINYGEAEKKLRGAFSLSYKFNNTSKPFLWFSTGIQATQFNSNIPISKLVNTISSLFFKSNFIKIYEQKFITLGFSQEISNGVYWASKLSYQKRKALINTSNYTLIKNNTLYTSNNPTAPTAIGSLNFTPHSTYLFSSGLRFNFKQNYLSYPNSKIALQNKDYPTLNINFKQAFGASNKRYNFQQYELTLNQNITLANKGLFSYYINAGTFSNAKTISFIDYKHFNGNQTHINLSERLNTFNNLPYYELSTNTSYAQLHTEHDFKGYILGKIPFLNRLNYNLVWGAKSAYLKHEKPYSEFSIGLKNLGWKKYRFMRIDYVRSYTGSTFKNDAVIFGLTF